VSNHRVEVGPFSFVFQQLRLPMGLNVARVDVQGTGATIDAKPFTLVLDRPGRMEAHVLERDLSEFLEVQAPGGLHGFDVRAEEGKLKVRAKKTLLVDLKIDAVATLRIVDGRQLWIDVESVDVMGAGAKNLVQSQLAKINPVIDAADFPVDATLTMVEVGNGEVVLYGTVAPPKDGLPNLK
jgi:hypothetical protein